MHFIAKSSIYPVFYLHKTIYEDMYEQIDEIKANDINTLRIELTLRGFKPGKVKHVYRGIDSNKMTSYEIFLEKV